VVLSKLQDHRAPVAAAALKAATMLMHHTQRSSPAALVNQMLRLQAQQQQGVIGQGCSGLVEILILVRHHTRTKVCCTCGLLLDWDCYIRADE